MRRLEGPDERRLTNNRMPLSCKSRTRCLISSGVSSCSCSILLQKSSTELQTSRSSRGHLFRVVGGEGMKVESTRVVSGSCPCS